MQELLNVKEVAEILGVSPRYIYTLIELERIPIVRIGRLIRFRIQDVHVWIQQRTRLEHQFNGLVSSHTGVNQGTSLFNECEVEDV